ncbi:neurogenic locus protein delta-like [Saccostrea echinata]|uniref:neurogenic locus protein delta-like n=1 Tax=Saccostrea echinata TaxID=191078 RepID=UPI002A81A6DE|nr:neurogenic locus protein delta-like [Saccostrea echinata]
MNSKKYIDWLLRHLDQIKLFVRPKENRLVAFAKTTFFIHIDEAKSTGNKLHGGSCCQGIVDSICTKLCKPVLTVYLIGTNHSCLSRFTTTLNMRRQDVMYGSKLGNSTNPHYLEVFSWNKYLDRIRVEVRDSQHSSSPLIYQTEFSDYNLQIGNNILSQHWRQKKLTANYFSDKNSFFIQITYKAYCSEGYYGSNCTEHCPGNPQKCVVNGHTYCKMGWHGNNCDEDIDECATRQFCGHGTCTNTAGSFHCTCPSSVHGLKCQLDEDECLLEPCNGGECVNKVGSYECQCRTGTTGRNCESLTAQQCNNNTCNNHGHCHVNHGNTLCTCNNEYTGPDCSIRNSCAHNQCQNGATCVIFGTNYTCHCSKGFTEELCEKIDYCATDPCKNSGSCTNTASGYNCSCIDHFMGQNCSTYDYCFGQNCNNRGKCQNRPNGYTCQFNDDNLRRIEAEQNNFQTVLSKTNTEIERLAKVSLNFQKQVNSLTPQKSYANTVSEHVIITPPARARSSSPRQDSNAVSRQKLQTFPDRNPPSAPVCSKNTKGNGSCDVNTACLDILSTKPINGSMDKQSDCSSVLDKPPSIKQNVTKSNMKQTNKRPYNFGDVSMHSVSLNDSIDLPKQSATTPPHDVFRGVKYKRKARFYISGIDRESTQQGILNYTENKGVKITHMVLFKPRTTRSQLTAKINIPYEQACVVEGHDFWPKGVSCRRWYNNRDWEARCSGQDHDVDNGGQYSRSREWWSEYDNDVNDRRK